MGTIEILSYAFTLQQCERLLKRLSKKSAAFYERNKKDLKAMCVAFRCSTFWGNTQTTLDSLTSEIWPPEFAVKTNPESSVD